MPRLTAEPVNHRIPAVTASPEERLQAKVAAGSRTQAILEQSLRHLHDDQPDPRPITTELIAKAKRVLIEAHDLIGCLKALADDPLLAGPPEQESLEADALAVYFRETAAMMTPAVRLAQGMPDTPSVQSRLADGLAGILSNVRQRLSALGHALDQRRWDADQVDRLAHLLVNFDAQMPTKPSDFIQLASEVLAEGPATPLRFLYAPPNATQSYLGGPAFPAPARFVACHSLTSARVMARMLRHAPEWREHRLSRCSPCYCMMWEC